MSREAARFLYRSSVHSRTPIATSRHLGNGQAQRLFQRRGFCGTPNLKVVKPYLLADIGEGELGFVACGLWEMC